MSKERPIEILYGLRKEYLNSLDDHDIIHESTEAEGLEEGWFTKKKKVEPPKPKQKPTYKDDYGPIVSEKEKEEMIKLFHKAIDDVRKIVKSALPGAKLYDEEPKLRKTQYENATVYHYTIGFISFQDNYKILRSKAKGSPLDELEDFSDADGNELYEVLNTLLFNKFKKIGFEEVDYTYGIFDHKKYEQLSITVDESFEGMGLSLLFAAEPEDEMINESFEPVTELFGRKKNKTGKKIIKAMKDAKRASKLEYPAADVKLDISKIRYEIKKMFKDEEALNGLLNNGINISKDIDTFEYIDVTVKEDGSEVYLSGDEFKIVESDLWDYKDGNPRILIDENNGNHPVYDGVERLRSLLAYYLTKNMPHFSVVENGGDWDTDSIDIKLK